MPLRQQAMRSHSPVRALRKLLTADHSLRSFDLSTATREAVRATAKGHTDMQTLRTLKMSLDSDAALFKLLSLES